MNVGVEVRLFVRFMNDSCVDCVIVCDGDVGFVVSLCYFEGWWICVIDFFCVYDGDGARRG